MKLLRHAVIVTGLALASPTLLAASDLALSSLAQQGRHHELIATLAPELKSGQEVSSFQLMMLAGSYYEVGRYGDATSTADRLEKRIKAGDATVFGSDLTVYPEIIRGAVALDLGLYDDALRHGAAALAQMKQNQFFYRSQLIMISNILGLAQALTGRTGDARQNLARIRDVSLFMSNLGPEKFTAMARIQLSLKDFAGALGSINDPAANVPAILTVFYDPTFQNLPRHFIRAKSLFELGQQGPARAGYDELLKHPQISQYGTLYWIVLGDRAQIAQADGDLPLAIDLLKKAVGVIEQRRSSIASEAGRVGFVGDKQTIYARLVELLLRQNQTVEAFGYVERAKSRALVDMLASQREFAAPGAGPEQVRRTLADIDALDRASLEKSAADAVAKPAPQTRSRAMVREQLSAASPELATLVSVGDTPTSELLALLPPGESLVEYYYANQNVHAFVLDSGQIRSVALDAQGLDADVQRLREALLNVDGQQWQELAARLHARLWQPLEPLLGNKQRVIVVAHGALHYLPFSVLSGSDKMPLAMRYSLRFLPSASVLKFLRPAVADARASLLALGNPDLGDPGLDLKFAGDEASAVSRLFPNARLLLRKDASESNLRKAGASFVRLHIASHGSFSAEAPLSSGLHLAKDADNDGMLTVGELYGMQLNADLVTLSACETGLGKVLNGDDIVGLGRGFLYAGARSIVASLWSVDDRATAQLMQAFYRNLTRMDKVEALRQAQMATRKDFPHPFFWAAFQLTGSAI